MGRALVGSSGYNEGSWKQGTVIKERGGWIHGLRELGDLTSSSDSAGLRASPSSALAFSFVIHVWRVNSGRKSFPAGLFYESTLLVNVLGTLGSESDTLSLWLWPKCAWIIGPKPVDRVFRNSFICLGDPTFVALDFYLKHELDSSRNPIFNPEAVPL